MLETEKGPLFGGRMYFKGLRIRIAFWGFLIIILV